MSIYHLDILGKKFSKAEYYKRLQERNKFLKELKNLKNEYYNLGSKLQDLFEKNKNLSLGRYSERVRSRRIVRKAELFNKWKIILIFVISCKILADILQSDIGAILRKDFDWKDKDFY